MTLSEMESAHPDATDPDATDPDGGSIWVCGECGEYVADPYQGCDCSEYDTSELGGPYPWPI